MDKARPILVTGAAGFIGFHLAHRLLKEGHQVVSIDCVNDYYDVTLKESRVTILEQFEGFTLHRFNLMDKQQVMDCFEANRFKYVVHLAAQAGVRHSLTHPQDYVDFNITAFLNVLEACRKYPVEHLIFASSSSVYGANTQLPFSVRQNIDHPMSFYAVSKKANELMAHAYAANYQIPCTGLRFFSAYGTYGRPDMALFIFIKKMLAGEPIEVYNHGDMLRDFTYIDDIVESIVRLLPMPAKPDSNWNSKTPNPSTSFGPYRIFNIGNNSPVKLMDYILTIESELGVKAEINFLPMQTGDVPQSYADATELYETIDFHPATPVSTGIQRFVRWYREYYKI